MLAGRGEVFDRPPTTRLLPQAPEDQGGSDASRRARRRRSLSEGVDNDGFGGETRARSQQALQLSALAQILDAAERGDHLLAHLRALATALDDLEIGAAARGFLAEIHGVEPFGRLIRGAHMINNYTKYIKGNIQTCGTTFSPASPLAPNKFNGLARQSQPQLLKISYILSVSVEVWAKKIFDVAGKEPDKIQAGHLVHAFAIINLVAHGEFKFN